MLEDILVSNSDQTDLAQNLQSRPGIHGPKPIGTGKKLRNPGPARTGTKNILETWDRAGPAPINFHYLRPRWTRTKKNFQISVRARTNGPWIPGPSEKWTARNKYHGKSSILIGSPKQFSQMNGSILINFIYRTDSNTRHCRNTMHKGQRFIFFDNSKISVKIETVLNIKIGN